MRDIPSRRRSEAIKHMADNLNMTDAFRTFFPSKREYTFIPSAMGANNRSRLDFFLVSEGALAHARSCCTPHSLISTVFDHKPIFLSFKNTHIKNLNVISNRILEDPDIEIVVRCAVTECHVQHAAPGGGIEAGERLLLLSVVGRILSNIKLKHEIILNLLSEGQEGINEEVLELRPVNN